MTAPSATITVPEVVDRFRAYHLDNPAWGALHIVLEDHNLEDSSVQFCINCAIKEDDVEGEALARILLQLSQSQRMKIAKRA